MAVRPILVGLILVGISQAAAVGAAVAQTEIDVFMEQVLEQRQKNWVALHGYVLDERETVELVGPDGRPLWSFDREFSWYVREGFLIRSPVRFDGVEIDEAERREFEEDWLQRERKRIERPRAPRRRRSRRGSFENITLTIERDWGGRVSDQLGRVLAAEAESRHDDFAVIVLRSDAVVHDLGGVEAIGFDRVVARVRDAFVLLELDRLTEPEVNAVVSAVLPRLVEALPSIEHGTDSVRETTESVAAAPDTRFDLEGFVDLGRLATRLALDDTGLSAALAIVATRLRELGYVTHAPAFAATPRAPGGEEDDAEPDLDAVAVSSEGLQPRFVSEAFFLDFEFEPGNYFFSGRDEIAGREVVTIEYYPEQMFSDENATVDSVDQEDRVEAAFDKTSLVTLWIDPEVHQIVKFTFDNLGFDFLPGRWLVRLDDLTASMVMGQPFDGIWLPQSIEVRGQISVATGSVHVRYDRSFFNYRQAEGRARIRSYGAVVNQPE